MFLKIKGIGKILDSTIEMKGITVIAGENNAGKSTFGKVLYCMFNAFYDAEDSIRAERVDDIRRIIRNMAFPRSRFYPVVNRLSKKLIEELANINEFSEDDICKIINDFISDQSLPPDETSNDNINTMAEKIKRSMLINDEEIQETVVSHYFGNEFEEKINHLNKPGSTGNISLLIHGKNIDVVIKDNRCEHFVDNIGIRHDAIYIDSPLVMDEVPVYYRRNLSPPRFSVSYSSQISHREKLIHRLSKGQLNGTVIEEVIIRQKIANLLSNFNLVTNGEFIENEGLMFMENGFKNPVPLSSVSTGIKMFLIIKRLLELGEIKERDVLIFDEPEIHLHPEWQIKFAEILVLLHKEFNLTILLTTHSPYFLRAIEVYSGKHGIKEQTNYYLARSEGDTSDVQNVTEKINSVYQQMALPFQKLEDVKYED